jgi:hypothetical protein
MNGLGKVLTSSVGTAAEFLRNQLGDLGPAGSPAFVIADGEPGDQATAATGAERGQQIRESIGDIRRCPDPVLGGWRNVCLVGIGARKITEVATHCTALPTDLLVALLRRSGVDIEMHMFTSTTRGFGGSTVCGKEDWEIDMGEELNEREG